MTTSTQSAATPAAPTSIGAAMRRMKELYPPLEQVTKPNLTTAELAYYSNIAEQTWRVKACYDTAPDGLRPLRVCGKLAWPTVGAKKLLGVTDTQKGYSTLAYLACIIGAALLSLMVMPGAFASLDWAGVAMLGAGVIGNRDYNDLSALVQAASKQDCIVHLHTGDDGKPVYSVGNSNIGAREFDSYGAAMAWVNGKAAK